MLGLTHSHTVPLFKGLVDYRLLFLGGTPYTSCSGGDAGLGFGDGVGVDAGDDMVLRFRIRRQQISSVSASTSSTTTTIATT